MNAVKRKPYEAPVIPNETIEANLSFLRTTVDEVKADMRGLQTDNRSLRDKIDDVRSELIHRIEQVRTELIGRIEQVRTELSARLDQVEQKLEAKIDQLAEKLSETNVAVAKVAIMQKAMLWIIGGAVSLASLTEVVIRVGEKFNWF